MIGITTGGIFKYDFRPDLYFRSGPRNFRSGAGSSDKPVHQLRDPVFPELIKKRLCPFKAGKDHTLPFTLREILHGGIPSLCRQGVCQHRHCGIKTLRQTPSGTRRSRPSIVSRYAMFIGSAMIRIRAGLPAGVRIQLRSEAV